MNKCRICLSDKRKLQSIFDIINGNGYSSFASMMMSVANVKIARNEGITEEICRRCSQKLKEAYDLKVHIERSDETLRNSAGFKRINFTNLQDEIQIKIDTTKEIPLQCYNDIADSFKNGQLSLVFKNITIQKIEADDIKIKQESEPLSVVDFLNSYKPEEDASYQADDDFDQCDDDYTPQSDDEDSDYDVPLSKCKTKDKKKNPKKKDDSKVAGNGEVKLVHIKPVILKDIKLMPSRTKEKTKKKPRDKRYMCNYCGKITSSKTHILLHTGVRSYKCDICSKAYLTPKQLEYHKKHHTLEKTFKCDKCVASFTTAALLKSHHNVHLNEYKLVCDTCNKSFKWKDSLKRHKMTHNAANKRVNCDLCNMSFFTKYSLKHHLRIHTGERPYKCEICNQPYSYKHDFNRHCLKKHGIFLKRRAVNVMNEEVLQRERALMRDLMLKMQGVTREGEPLNPFEVEGPQGAMAFELAIKALKSNNIPID